MPIIHFVILFISVATNCASSKGPPTHISDSKYQKINRLQRGQSLRLFCPVRGTPEPLIYWSKDDKAIHVGYDRIEIKADKLSIKQVEESDSGHYACQATNGFGQLTSPFIVCVTDNTSVSIDADERVDESQCVLLDKSELPPSILDRTGDKLELYPDGESEVRLECRVSAASKARVRWSKDGSYLPPDGQPEDFLFTLKDVTSADSGHYACHASNNAGTTNFTFIVQVQEKDKSYFIQLENVTVFVDAAAIFDCQVKSSDEHTHMKWLRQVSVPDINRNTSPKPLHVRGHYYNVLHEGIAFSNTPPLFSSTLTIPQATKSNAGVYVCWAGSPRGFFEIRHAFLTVLPLNVLSEPKGVEPSDNTEHYASVFVAIGCVIGVIVLVLVIYVVRHQCCTTKRSSSNSPATPSSHGSTSATSASAGHPASNRKSNTYSDAASHPPPPSWPVASSSLQRCPGYSGGAIASRVDRQVQGQFVQKPLLQQQDSRGLLSQDGGGVQEVQYRYYEQC